MKETSNYTSVAKIIHWLMAILIIAEFGLAYLFLASKTVILKPIAEYIYFLHFNIGFTILLLFVIRIFWRLTHRPPAYAESFHKEEIKLAHYGHMTIYLLIGVMVLTGVLRYNIHTGDFHYLNFITIPAIIHTHDMLLYSVIAITHNLCGALLLTIVAVHIAMAVRHHIIDKNDILLRMLPNCCKKK